MFFWVFNVLLLVLIFGCLILVSGVWPPDSPWSPWWKTTRSVARVMCRLAKVGPKDRVYDLGCGTGDALVVAGKEFKATGVGVEIDPVRYLIAKKNIKKAKLEHKIVIVNENFFNVDLHEATVLMLYLVPRALKKLTPKFLKELPSGTRIVSYRYEFPVSLYNGKLKLIATNEEHKFYVYEMKK